MLEKLKQQNIVVRILIFYGFQFVYFYMRLSMYPENSVISRFPVFFFVVDIITFLIFATYLIKIFHFPVKSHFFSWKTLGWLLIGLLFVVLSQNLYVWLAMNGFLPPDSNSTGVSDFTNQFPLAGFFFGCIMAPVIEELIFRGVFFRLFFQKLTKWRPFLQVLVSGLIFGSIHVQAGGFAWQNLLFYSGMGVALGTIYYFNKDLKLNMLIHFANNATIQFAPFIFYLLWKLLM